MAFFAVLGADDLDDFQVSELHANLWSLAAFGVRRRSFVFDVGVLIKAGTRPVGKFSLAIPFGTSRAESLTELVKQPQIAGLIFDTQVSVDANTIKMGGRSMVIADIANTEVAKSHKYSDDYFSLWDIPLVGNIAPGESAYVRIRFPITGLGRTWQWQRRLFRKTGVTFDLRVADLRSTQNVTGRAELVPRIRPIESVAAFVMIPAWLHSRTIEPGPHYIRLLEGKVWGRYLGRAAEVRQRSRLVVYHWKNKKSEDPTNPGTYRPVPVTSDKPLRIYADFAVERNARLVSAVVASSTLSVVGSAIVFDVDYSDAVSALFAWIGGAVDWSKFAFWTLGPVALYSMIKPIARAVIDKRQDVYRVYGGAKWLFLSTEAKIFSALSRLRS